jgi:glycerol dehydrogenase
MHGEKVAFGLITQLVLEGKPSALINEVMAFCIEVGLPVHLGMLGIAELTAEKLDTIAGRATAPGETSHNEPFEITPKLMADAIIAADSLGKRFHHFLCD